jgi:type VI protein secretion system component VasK
MTFIDIFTWIVLFIAVATVVVFFVFMGLWPGKVASQNNHPQAEAIKIGSWVALIMGFALWPVVLVWAYTKPANANTAEHAAALDEKIAALETRLSELESTLPKSNQEGAS